MPLKDITQENIYMVWFWSLAYKQPLQRPITDDENNEPRILYTWPEAYQRAIGLLDPEYGHGIIDTTRFSGGADEFWERTEERGWYSHTFDPENFEAKWTGLSIDYCHNPVVSVQI